VPAHEPAEPVDVEDDDSGVMEPFDDSALLPEDLPGELADPTDDEVA
jgi:hypothetical protein